jgi:probable F420-dependent oxidoreductase
VIRCTVELPITEPAAIGDHARAIEAAGFDACYVTDHPAPPRAWLEHGGHPTVDPFVALTAAAAATTTLQLHVHVLIPAYRHPLPTAKAIATLDAVSNGRVILGVAAGYLEPEFEALGVPFAERAARLDGALHAMKDAWTSDGDPVVLPRPVQQPYPRIWVGGNTPAAMRRAVAHGTGWSPFPASSRMAAATGTAEIGDIDALARAIERFRKTAAEGGRGDDRFDICFTPFSYPAYRDDFDPAAVRAEVIEYERLGVTWIALHGGRHRLDDIAAAVRG